MRNIAMLIRILALIGFLFLPKAFNYWKAQGHGSAIRQHFRIHYVDVNSLTNDELKSLSDRYIDDGVKCATFMILGFNIPILACIFLSTYIATPRKTGKKKKLYLLLYLGFVILGVACLSFGFPYHNQHLQEMSMAVIVACVWWLILGGIPLAIAFLCRFISIRNMKNNA